MSQDSEHQAIRAEAGVVAMENLLADGSRADVLFVMRMIDALLDALFYCGQLCGVSRDNVDQARDRLEIAITMTEPDEA